jgi:hypothetical protein
MIHLRKVRNFAFARADLSGCAAGTDSDRGRDGRPFEGRRIAFGQSFARCCVSLVAMKEARS